MQSPTIPIRKSAGPENRHTVSVRRATSEDLGKLRGMASRLSQQTIYERFHAPYPAVPDWMLSSVLNLDDRAGGSLVAVAGDEIVGHAMYVRSADGDEAEIAVVVEDGWQSQGIGKLLIRRLAIEAGRRGVKVFVGAAVGENRRVLGLLRSVFSGVQTSIEDGSYLLRIPLRTLGQVAECTGQARIIRPRAPGELALAK
ncbi:MAG: GNAT family N-acetyltransferase [Rubrobacteraceae bacterium]